MPVDELVDPVGYSGWWTVAGLGLLLLAGAVVFAVLWFTRARAVEKDVRPPAGGYLSADRWAALRSEYEARLDAVERRYHEGELDERALHLALSAEVRAFASRRLGQDASSMTLSEIQQLSGAGHLTQLIASYYRPSFAEDQDPRAHEVDPGSSVARARTVVRTW
ncbi:hypothetical protein [Cellulosimicrobium arenosum]|uniref:Uncharacterized protein n=1 Tax=Cellulosimicrobium arenosum TaxID=2708133 RepID=A0A927J1R6_9MICO|nr:hypothetical protein [Cellulosimicrobium arenosum]MBD8080334.1 hypothetical protein [Cellulosimicrobium arenosum]